MRKLGKRQFQILQVMAERNSIIRTVLGRTFHVFFSSRVGKEINKILTFDRLFALEDRGLIENITEEGWRWQGSQYRITEKGLALVVKEEQKCDSAGPA